MQQVATGQQSVTQRMVDEHLAHIEAALSLESGGEKQSIDISEFRRVLIRHMQQCGIEGRRDLVVRAWTAFCERQENPLFQPEDILQFYSAKRSAIESLHIVSHVKHRSKANKPFELVYTEEFADDGQRILLRRLGGSLPEFAMSYDGHCVRTFTRLASGRQEGGISHLTTRAGFGQTYCNVLWYMMLADSLAEMGVTSPQNDLRAFITSAPFERIVVGHTPIRVRGRTCVRVSRIDQDVFLDLDRDLCLVRLQTYTDESTNREGDPLLVQRRELLEYKNFGNSVWLPTKGIEERFTKDGERTDQWNITWKIHSVNEPLSSQLFEEIIPEGTLVADMVKGQSYYVGQHGSIASMLKDQIVPPSPPTDWRLVLLISNICAAVIVTAVLVLKKVRGLYAKR